jgi:GNAT superfamily N-acetyltransferase
MTTLNLASQIQIASLADHLDLVPAVAQWLYQEWDYLYPGGSLQTRTQQVYERAQPEGIPTVFIALAEGTPVGTSCLLEYDSAVDRAIEAAHLADVARGQADPKWLETRVIPTPWLASVYVIPEYRRRGIASRLVCHAMQTAQRLGIETLYLYTDTAGAEALYQSLGWQVLERLVYPDMHTTLMFADLNKLEWLLGE